MKPGTLGITETVQDDCCTLVVTGELDLLTAPQLEAAVEHACQQHPQELVIDLREMSFIDSNGLRALLATLELCDTQHIELFLHRSAQPFQRRFFEITGMLDQLPFASQTTRQGPRGNNASAARRWSGASKPAG